MLTVAAEAVTVEAVAAEAVAAEAVAAKAASRMSTLEEIRRKVSLAQFGFAQTQAKLDAAAASAARLERKQTGEGAVEGDQLTAEERKALPEERQRLASPARARTAHAAFGNAAAAGGGGGSGGGDAAAAAAQKTGGGLLMELFFGAPAAHRDYALEPLSEAEEIALIRAEETKLREERDFAMLLAAETAFEPFCKVRMMLLRCWCYWCWCWCCCRCRCCCCCC